MILETWKSATLQRIHGHERAKSKQMTRLSRSKASLIANDCMLLKSSQLARSILRSSAIRPRTMSTFKDHSSVALASSLEICFADDQSASEPNSTPPKDMTVFKNIVSVASSSGVFRRVLWTGKNSQFVLMTIPVKGDSESALHHC